MALLTTLFETQWIASLNHRNGYFKKCKLQCDEFFLPSPCKFEKDGLWLDLEQELFESADDDVQAMSRAKTKIPLTVHCLLINWLGSGLAGLNNFSNDEEVLTLVFSLLVVSTSARYFRNENQTPLV